MGPPVKIPLFPLGVVLLPGTVLPLHIFEERYKIMIGECLAEDKEFGVLYFESSKMRKIGCTARIIEVLKRYDDGRMDIVTQGNRRFSLKDIFDERPYLQAEVDYFDDAAEERHEEVDELIREGVDLLGQFDSLTGKQEDYSVLLELDYKIVSFWISNSSGFTTDEKQTFLEMTSTSERLKKSVASLKKIVEQTKTALEIKRIIGGNGDPREEEV